VQSFKKFFLEAGKVWCAVVLDQESKNKLLKEFGKIIPKGWIVSCSHMTIDEQHSLQNEADLGKEVALTVMSIASSKEYLAVKVSGYPRQDGNDFSHVTIAEDKNNVERYPLSFEPFETNLILHGKIENITEDRHFL
jgi:hypothetical protein